MRHIERGAQLRETLLCLFGSLPVSFRGGPDAQGPQKVGGGPSRISGLAEDGMKSLAGQMVKYQVNDAPGIECLVVEALWMDVHTPTQRWLT